MSASLPLGWRVRAVASALTIAPLPNVASLARLGRWLGRAGPAATNGRSADAPPDDQVVADWVSGLLRRLPWPWRYTCLRRSLVLYHLLRRAGRAVELRVGVRKESDGALAAHAWLVRDGAPYLEPDPAMPGRFSVIARLPETQGSP